MGPSHARIRGSPTWAQSRHQKMVREAPCLPWMALRLGTGHGAPLCAHRRQGASALRAPPQAELTWLPPRARALPVCAAWEAHTLRPTI